MLGLAILACGKDCTFQALACSDLWHPGLGGQSGSASIVQPSPWMSALAEPCRADLWCAGGTANRLQALGMVNSKGKVPAGSHWIFTWGPQDELLAEGISLKSTCPRSP